MCCASPLPMAVADTGTTTIVLVGVTDDPDGLTTVTVAGILLAMAPTRLMFDAVDRVCSVVAVVWFTMPGVMLTMRGATDVVNGAVMVIFAGMFATVLAIVSHFN